MCIFQILTWDSVLKSGFSERKWKEKLKEWKFDKNVSSTHMNILIAKAEKRAREDGKETVFFYGETQISAERIKQFKRRKTCKDADVISPRAGTIDCQFNRVQTSS